MSAWQGHLMDVAFLVSILEGAHLNPAFSLAMCLLGRLPWGKLPIYSLVQLLSAFCASGATYALYYGNRERRWGHLCVGRGLGTAWNEQRQGSWALPSPADALQNYTGGNLTVTGPKETASIFATYPAPYLSLKNGFLDQVPGRGPPGRALTFAPTPWGPSLYCSGSGGMGCGVGPTFAPGQTPAACVGQNQVTGGGVACTVWVTKDIWQLVEAPLPPSTPRS